MSTVIKVENLHKEYRLGSINHGVLFRDIQSWWARKRGKEDPHSIIGENYNESGDRRFMALQNLNFEINAGESIGIIGKNGAGKSTLLKILSRVTTPTKGTVKIKGRVASLLEVGTGFHPELTGRENVFLNGAILGLNKSEIRSRFDEIVEFSGVEKFIDTPVKRYSSGMKVRLAFSVAAHLDPEILIVDEVLAVGDADFQKRCLGKMQEVGKEGRTVVFVSHNMPTVHGLCSRGIVLKNGNIHFDGDVESAISQYSHMGSNLSGKLVYDEEGDPLKILELRMENKKKEIRNSFYIDEPIFIYVKYEVVKSLAGIAFPIVHVYDNIGNPVFNDKPKKKWEAKKGIYEVCCKIEPYTLNNITYALGFDLRSISARSWKSHFIDHGSITFDVKESAQTLKQNIGKLGKHPGVVRPWLTWSIKKQN